MIARIFDWLANRWQCVREGHNFRWAHNYYGDQIIYSGGKRSAWKCRHCGKYEDREEMPL